MRLLIGLYWSGLPFGGARVAVGAREVATEQLTEQLVAARKPLTSFSDTAAGCVCSCKYCLKVASQPWDT